MRCLMQVQGGEGRRQRQIREKRVINRDEVYDGALEEILSGKFILYCSLPVWHYT